MSAVHTLFPPTHRLLPNNNQTCPPTHYRSPVEGRWISFNIKIKNQQLKQAKIKTMKEILFSALVIL